MCGIFGFVGVPDMKRLEMMAASMSMRGPDDVSYYVDGDVSMGMVRLAVVDKEHGKQPFVSESGNVVVFYNGEVYNWRELRESLELKGHEFHTACDGEVIPHLYEEYGSKLIDKLDGMFAIAIWDKAKKQLWLARDHAGVKPLFYDSKRRVFGSSTYVVREYNGRISPSFDYWTWGYPMQHAVWENVETFPANTCMDLFDGRDCTHRPFSSRAFYFKEDDLLPAFRAAVKKRMIADRPIGLFLSGGLDSACVLAEMVQHVDPKTINTYTLCFEPEPDGKETDRVLARMLADKYGTTHHEVTVTPDDVWDALPEIADVFDQPFAGCISTYFLAKEAKKSVDCVMTGDGADELFGSYLSHRMAAQIRTVPVSRWRSGLCLRDTTATLDIDYMNGRDQLDNLLRWEWQNLFPACVLAFADTLSMAWAIEQRSPFIDKHLVDVAFSIPSDRKIDPKSGTTKKCLRSMAVELAVPLEVIMRKKEGFVQPSIAWMRTHWKDKICCDLLADGYVDLKRHFYVRNNDNYGYRLWATVCYAIWEKAVLNVGRR